MPYLNPENSMRAWRLWKRGMDTLQIAHVLKVDEAAVYNSLGKIRDVMRSAA